MILYTVFYILGKLPVYLYQFSIGVIAVLLTFTDELDVFQLRILVVSGCECDFPFNLFLKIHHEKNPAIRAHLEYFSVEYITQNNIRIDIQR